MELPHTRVGKLCLYENQSMNGGRHGKLLYTCNANRTIVLLSVASVEQEFEKEYICTSGAYDSMVQEVDKSVSDALLAAITSRRVASVKIKARYIHSLDFKTYAEKQEDPSLFDISITFPNWPWHGMYSDTHYHYKATLLIEAIDYVVMILCPILSSAWLHLYFTFKTCSIAPSLNKMEMN